VAEVRLIVRTGSRVSTDQSVISDRGVVLNTATCKGAALKLPESRKGFLLGAASSSSSVRSQHVPAMPPPSWTRSRWRWGRRKEGRCILAYFLLI